MGSTMQVDHLAEKLKKRGKVNFLASIFKNGLKKKLSHLKEGYLTIEDADEKFNFGDKNNPLLVSVRSGARASMPGMMDTVLNLGLNDDTVIGLAKKSNNERFAYDSYRRFIQMFSDVVLGIDHYHFEEILDLKKNDKGITLDTELDAEDLKDIVSKYKKVVENELGKPFPTRT